jgi:RHS repeat-associated protein
MYTGRNYDAETGLHFFRNRYYSDVNGRFISRDPIGYKDGMSLYRSYFGPNGMDPSGFEGFWGFVSDMFFGADSTHLDIVTHSIFSVTLNIDYFAPVNHTNYTTQSNVTGMTDYGWDGCKCLGYPYTYSISYHDDVFSRYTNHSTTTYEAVTTFSGTVATSSTNQILGLTGTANTLASAAYNVAVTAASQNPYVVGAMTAIDVATNLLGNATSSINLSGYSFSTTVTAQSTDNLDSISSGSSSYRIIDSFQGSVGSSYETSLSESECSQQHTNFSNGIYRIMQGL